MVVNTNGHKSAVAIRHLMFEGLGILEPLLKNRGYQIRYIEAGISNLNCLDIFDADLLIVLGGPIGALDEHDYPFLQDELALIKARLDAALPTLGICLGAQLMARARGAKVSSMKVKEIGFSPVRLTVEGSNSCLLPLGKGVEVLHWHGDEFGIPAGAMKLAYSDACANQAFSIGSHALALQFHLEADCSRIEQWLIGHTAELRSLNIAPNEIRLQSKIYGQNLKRIGDQIFGSWLDNLDLKKW